MTQISVELSESGSMEGSDYVEVYYILDGGSETLFEHNGRTDDDFSQTEAFQDSLQGNTVQIVIRIRNNSGSEYHYIDYVEVRDNSFWSEHFVTYSDGTNNSIKWTVNDSSLTLSSGDEFEVDDHEFQANDIDGEGIWRSEEISIINHDNVSLRLRLSESGSMEGSDYLRVYYKLDGGPEVLFDGGDLTDDFGDSTLLQTIDEGETVQIIAYFQNNSGSEYHHIRSVDIFGCFNPDPRMGFASYRELTVNSGYVCGSIDLEDFPLLVNITEDYLRSASLGGDIQHPQAFDIMFTDSTGTQSLDFNIEAYDSTTGSLVAWVKVPTLSASSNTKVRMYYSKDSVTTSPASDILWQNYTAVYHMSNDSLNDESTNGHDGINNGSTQATGVFAGGRQFDGTDDYIDIGNFKCGK